MTTRDDFSTQEWALLGNAPLAAAAAVALAEPGGGRREADAIIDAWRTAEGVFAGSRLLRDLMSDFDPEEPKVAAEPPAVRSTTIEDEAVALCHRAMDLLAERTTNEECANYRAFVLHIATRVAEAEGGGLFGLGGVAVTLNEQSTLRAIRIALDSHIDPLA